MNTETLVKQLNLLNSLVHALQKQKATLQSESQRLNAEFNLLALDHDRVLAECTHLRQKKQELINSNHTLNSQLKRYREVQQILGKKQNETAFLKIQNQKCQAFIAKNNETITQLSLRNHELEKLIQARTSQYGERIRDLENNKLPQLILQNQLKDIKIGELNEGLTRMQVEISNLKMKLTEQAHIYKEQKLILEKEMNQKYNEITKSNDLVQTLQKNISEIQEQFIRKENLQKQQLASFEKQVNRLQEQIRIVKQNNFLEAQIKSQKDKFITSLKNIISEQQTSISEKTKTTQKLTEIIAQKDRQIENLQANNSMLRNQILTALANQESSRKEIIMHKQQLRKSNQLNAQVPKKNANFYRKRLTVLTQKVDANRWQDCDFRRSEANVVFSSQKNVDGSLKEKITVPSQENDDQQV